MKHEIQDSLLSLVPCSGAIFSFSARLDHRLENNLTIILQYPKNLCTMLKRKEDVKAMRKYNKVNAATEIMA